MSAPDCNGNRDSGARTCLCGGTCYRNCHRRSTPVHNANIASGALFGSTPSFPFSATQNSNSFGSTTGASFRSTSSSPFFGTQNSTPFGNAVGGASNGSTSSSPFFGTQNSSPFGNAVGGASNGSTFSSPFFGTQNSSPFGIAVGGASNVSTFSSPFSATQSSNASGSGAAFNDYTSAYGVVPNQSSMPFGFGTFGTAPSTPFPFRETSPSSTGFGFGCPAGTNTSPFAQPSLRFPGFGGATNTSFGQMPPRFGEAAKTSPFGQTPSVFGGFGATSTAPLFGKTDPSFSTFREASSTTPTSKPQPWTPFPFGGGGPAITDNSCEGTRCAPYQPTREENNLSWNNGSRDVLTSISAMYCYCNKNHEELRLEDYKQMRNRGYSSAAHASVFSNPLPNPFSFSSTNPSQPANSPGWFPPSDFAFKRSSENPFQKTSGSPAIVDNSCGETRAPYQPTLPSGSPAIVDNSCGENRAPYQPTPAEENNLPWNNGRPVLTSISAMNCYCNNSHEELRLEDYKQTRNGGPSSAANVFGVSNPLPNPVSVPSTNPVQPANSSGWFPPCELPLWPFDRSSENPIQRTDSSSSLNSNNNCTTPTQTSPVQTSVSQTRPFPTPTTTTTVSSKTSNVNLNDLTLSTTASGEIPFIPSLVNCIIPAFGAFDINGGPLSSELGTPVLGFPVLIPTTLAFIPQYPQVSNPTSPLPLLQSETHFNPRMVLPNSISTATTSTPAAATSSRVLPSAGVLGGQNSSSSTSASVPAPTTATSSATQHSSSIPKGLEIIVEHLGFNPWEGKSHLKDSQDGQFLLCEDASDDADILSLAEFAVEQHNAMEQDVVKVELLKVTAACLEAVDGGRYHIVLEASSGIRFYAAVLRKNTDRSTPLIVLERWLQPSKFL